MAASPASRCCGSDLNSPAMPIARHMQLIVTWSFLLMGSTMVLFGTVRANGAVIGPLIILAIGLVPVRLGFALAAYPWLKADALWFSFPVSSLANGNTAATPAPAMANPRMAGVMPCAVTASAIPPVATRVPIETTRRAS